MTMAYNIEKLRKSSDPKDAVYADMIEAVLESRGEDIPLPEVKLQDTREHIAPVMGVIALADSREAPTTVDLSDTNETIDRQGKLHGEVSAMTYPFVTAAALKMPLAKENSRSMLGKLKDRDSVEWIHEQIAAGRALHYNLTVPFIPGEEYNNALGLNVRIGTRKKQKRGDLEVGLHFNDNAVELVTMEYDTHSDSSFSDNIDARHLANDLVLKKFGDEFARQENLRITIETNASIPRVIIESKVRYGFVSGKKVVIYTYDPSKDIFEATETEGGETKVHAPMTVEEYKERLGAILAAIPTM